ncbi:MAG TPA: 4-hydroxythreonine-4-phosphate dehydrogenase PdxA [Pirellulales bacterium]|jgi:4-hydroxythreonine-4-phosphate dehydrogenase|nr:4-hydroxythreonine-4-phosphate dehydrogenase PdxA [Pirellulales bacterium]
MQIKRPLLAITMGDPAGVGPETIVGAWGDPRVHEWCDAVVIGHPVVLRRAVDLLRSRCEIVSIEDVADARSSPECMPCLPCGSTAALDVPPATIDPRSGEAAYEAVVRAAELALARRVGGIVTAPLHKAALWQAGHHYPGHTELLAELCGVHDFAMMLYLGPDETIRGPAGLGVVHVTLHMALRDVFAHLTREAIVAKANLADKVTRLLRRAYGLAAEVSRIGVCALNPHAGEEGLFGDEERTIIRPAVEDARAAGLNITGPLPTDTLMVRARDGEFDAVVAMVHDQGHIALKLLGMHRAVNITLGLPIVRTSVAHGTAFDLAWQGRAQTSSMVEAIRVAAGLASAR